MLTRGEKYFNKVNTFGSTVNRRPDLFDIRPNFTYTIRWYVVNVAHGHEARYGKDVLDMSGSLHLSASDVRALRR